MHLLTRLHSLFVTVFFLVSIQSTQAEGIRYPWRAAPVIVLHGNRFDILFDNKEKIRLDSIRLEDPYNHVKLALDRIDQGSHVYDTYTQASVNTRIWVAVPAGTPEELYDLVIYTPKGSHRSAKSVKVIREYRKQHRFIHISDPHVSRQWVGTPENGYAKELELFDKFVDIANIIAPDFILSTGDLIHDYTRLNANSSGWGGTLHKAADEKPSVVEKYSNYYEGAKGFKGISGLNSPTFSIAGNHDFYGLDADDYMGKSLLWNELNGKRVYGMSYGDTRVLFMDDFLGDPDKDVPDHAPLSGLQGEVLKRFLETDGSGKIRILAQHRPDRIDTAFCDTYGIKLVLNGHDHTPFQELLGKTPTRSIRPGSISRSGSVSEWEKVLGFFRVFTIEEGGYTFTEPLRIVTNPIAAYDSLESNMRLNFLYTNDGTQSRNEATIDNRFPSTFRDCAARFVMKKGDYIVEGANIKQVIESDILSVVDVTFDVSGGETKKISIRPR